MSGISDNQTQPLQSETDNGEDPLLGEFLRLKTDINEAEQERGKWRKEAKECYNFVAGKQWNDTDTEILRNQNRPAITFNRVAPILKAVCGLEVNNRQETVYLPRKVSSTGKNDLLTSAGRWVRGECQAEDEESLAFRDAAICGEGWVETRMDYDDRPEGKIVEERIYPLEMGVKKGAFRANYTDAQMIYRVRKMDPDDVRALLDKPDLIDAALDAKWITSDITPEDGGQGNKRDYPEETRASLGDRDRGKRKAVTVVQVQYWVREPVYIVAGQDSEQPMHLTSDEFAKLKERADATDTQIEHARSVRKKYYECFIGQRILDKRELSMGRFQFQCMTAERDEEAKCFYGIVRDMLDPQRWANKWLAQNLHILNSNAKGGLIAETDAFINTRKAQKDWSDPTKIVWVKPGSLQKQKIKERQSFNLPPGLESMMMFAISSIRDVTGVNLELLGQADREQAASLEAQRRQSAMTVLASLFNSLRRFRKNQGALLLHFIIMLPEGTLIRLGEQSEAQYVPLIKEDADPNDFDTIIDQAPTSPDQKQFVWQITAQILQMNILPPPVVIELLKYSPYPESVVQEIKKAMGQDGLPPAEQLAEQLKQAEGALKFMEQKLQEAQDNAKTAEDDRALEMQKLELEEYAKFTDRLKAQWDARAKLMALFNPKDQAEGEAEPDAGQESSNDEMQQAQPAAPNSLEAKVDALAGMMQHLIQTLGGQQQQMEPVPPPDAPPAEPTPTL